MLPSLFLTTIISCSDAMELLSRMQKVIGLSQQQKAELIQVIRQTIPSCPIKIERNERTK